MSDGNPFIRFCLSGLERMYLRSEGVFTYSYRSPVSADARRPDKEYRYTMNTLMGLHRARECGYEIFLDPESVYCRLAKRVGERSGSAEDVAATVWAGRELGASVPREARELLSDAVRRQLSYGGMTGQAVAWTIAACLKGGDCGIANALELARFAAEHYVHPRSSLVRHTLWGLRRDWASFAPSCYLAYSFLLLSRAARWDWAREIGLRIALALVALQGPQGQWGWFYHIPAGRVADYYPVYSVHQHAMAPLFLLEAIEHGRVELEEALRAGLLWVLGRNELRTSLVAEAQGVIWRSAVRREPLGKLERLGRAVRAGISRSPACPEPSAALTVNRECRSYELGWALWAFAGGADRWAELRDRRFVLPGARA